MTHDLPRNDADNRGPVDPADQCDDDYYSDEAIAKREAHLSAKYGHLKAAADERQHERERIAEANRRSKERLRELADELGYWPASTDEEHVARLRAQDARYAEQAAQDPDGTKWQKMMPSRGDGGHDAELAKSIPPHPL